MITVGDLETRFGRTFTATETAQATAFIADAEALVVETVGDATVTDVWATTPPAAVIPVLVNMVRRAMDNPHGLSGETNERYSYTGGKPEGIFATGDEVRALRRAANKTGVGALDLEGYLPWSPASAGGVT